MITITLASQSPRRRAILEQAGFTVEVCPPDVDESARPGEDPIALVERLARSKCAAQQTSPDRIVVAGDTVVILAGEVLGKPCDDREAVAMLQRLSGSVHQVVSGWCVRRGSHQISGVELTTVTFRTLTESEIAAYVATGEPLDKAGAYGIQERGGAFVERVEGSLDNVAGLPLEAVVSAIEKVAPASPAP